MKPWQSRRWNPDRIWELAMMLGDACREAVSREALSWKESLMWSQRKSSKSLMLKIEEDPNWRMIVTGVDKNSEKMKWDGSQGTKILQRFGIIQYKSVFGSLCSGLMLVSSVMLFFETPFFSTLSYLEWKISSIHQIWENNTMNPF